MFDTEEVHESIGNAGEREAEIFEEEKRFQSLGVTYDVWSPRQLQEKLRPHYGIANQYLNEFIAKQICGSPQAQISSPEHNPEHNTVIIGALTAELKNVLAEKTEKELEAARESVRQGKTKSISNDLEKLKNDKSRWPSANPRVSPVSSALVSVSGVPQNSIAPKHAPTAGISARFGGYVLNTEEKWWWR